MNFNRLFFDFCETLADCSTYMTEDGIRYSFFECMRRQDQEMNHYILELPYELMIQTNEILSKHNKELGIYINPNILKTSGKRTRQELDMYYFDKENEIICIELKFHRNPDTSAGKRAKSDFAHTNAAGRIINDMRRLALIHPSGTNIIRRLFVYVTDNEMHDYLTNDEKSNQNEEYRHRLALFYQNGGDFSWKNANDIRIPDTFYECANASFDDTSKKQKMTTKEKKSFSVTVDKLLYVTTNTGCFSFINNTFHLSVFEVHCNEVFNHHE